MDWVLIGGPGDTEKLSAIKKYLPHTKIYDTCDLGIEELAGVICQLEALVGVDTGPLHLARLLAIRTLALFGPTSIRRWGPGPFEGSRHVSMSLGLPCQPCSNHGGESCPLRHHDCMKDLAPEQVASRLKILLETSS